MLGYLKEGQEVLVGVVGEDEEGKKRFHVQGSFGTCLEENEMLQIEVVV